MSAVLDPILKTSETPIPVEAGTVLVATGRRGAVAFVDGAGPTFGERMFGGYKQYHLVTVAQQLISDAFDVQSKQISYKFRVKLEYRVTVLDPAAIVTRGIRDLRELVGAGVKKAAASAARIYTVDSSLDALGAVEGALEDAAKDLSRPGDDATTNKAIVKVEIISVLLEPDEAAKVMLATKDQEAIDIAARESKARVIKAQRAIESEVTEDDNELMLQFLATGDDKYRQLLEARVHQGELSYQRLVEIFDKLREDKAIEAFELQKMFPNIGDQLMEALQGRIMPPKRGKKSSDVKALSNSPGSDADAIGDATPKKGSEIATDRAD